MKLSSSSKTIIGHSFLLRKENVQLLDIMLIRLLGIAICVY